MNNNDEESPRSGNLLDTSHLSPRSSEYRRSYSAPVQPDVMNDRTTEPPATSSTAAGSLRPPGELGVAPSHSSTGGGETTMHAAGDETPRPRSIAQQRRLQRAVERGRASVPSAYPSSTVVVTTTLCYHGMEIAVATASDNVYVVCPRTRLVLQTLPMLDQESPSSITHLVSHPVSGVIAALTMQGNVITWRPAAVDPRKVSVGRYRWELAVTWETEGGTLLALSPTDHCLVAEGDVVGVYRIGTSEADLVWTTRLPAVVTAVALAGDGKGLAVVLQEVDEQDSAGSPGVHTFYHDSENDGSEQDGATAGMVYKPGPFLVHPAPVTGLAFRGFGHCTSSRTQGNDLLLTQCEGRARIFSQNNWSPLTEWKTPRDTTVSWIEGVTAWTINDWENPPARPHDPSDRPGWGQRLHFPSSVAPRQTPTHAGAWVSELTYHRSTMATAIRVCRLAYWQRAGNDVQPTLLECVSQYIPGRLEDVAVTGVWPAWNREAPNPPIELRLVGRTKNAPGRVSVVTLSVLEDTGRTITELGYPEHTVWALDVLDKCAVCHSSKPTAPSRKPLLAAIQASSWYGSSRLVAQVEGDGSSVSMLWRQPGTSALLPREWLPEDVDPTRAARLFAQSSNRLTDESHIPVPLGLPSILIPHKDEASVIALLWWPEDKDVVNGAPLLVAVCSDGTILVWEVPPPWSCLEPRMPMLGDPPSKTMPSEATTTTATTQETMPQKTPNNEYEIFIVPDPDYGLGIRLESHPDGMCAVAGTFKRHPVTGDLLPAERSGLVRLGDELLAANDVKLANKPFDDIVGVVRDLGSASGPGNPLRLQFRSSGPAETNNSPHHRPRRTMEEMIGVAAEAIGKNKTIRNPAGDPEPEEPSLSLETLVASFPTALPAQSSVFELIPLEDDSDATVQKVAMLFWALDNSLGVTAISISYASDGKVENSASTDVMKANNTIGSRDQSIVCLEVVTSGGDNFTIATCSPGGTVHIATLSLDRSKLADSHAHEFHSYRALCLPTPWTKSCSFRLNSVFLFATLQPNGDQRNEITVWSAFTDPKPTEENAVHHYRPTSIDIGKRSDDFEILDFSFFQPGYLDSSPLIATMSMQSLSLFAKTGGLPSWSKTLEVSYGSPSWSSQPQEKSYLEVLQAPLDTFPQLIAASCASYSSTDEQSFLRSSWHPDSLIAGVCASPHGIPDALVMLRKFFTWIFSDGREIPVGHRFSNLVVAPLDVTEIKVKADTASKPPSHGYSGMPSIAVRSSEISNDVETAKTILLQLIRCKEPLHRTLKKEVPGSTDTDGGQDEIPSIWKTMELDDLKCLWALADLTSNPPMLDKLDSSAESFAFAFALFEALSSLSKENNGGPKNPSMPAHSMMTRSPSNRIVGADSSKVPPVMASSGAVAAFLSSNQNQLVEMVSQGRKLTWKSARECRVALWRRSDSKLAELASKIGQNIFLETRDTMEAALFFIISGKLSTFRNYVRTDQSATGKTLSQFLTKHDFASERGRRAAEKNAFSLLRKCKYQAAAAFFLLAEPPFLKSAVETIATKMLDIDLAFLVARLMESPSRSTWPSGRSGGGGLGTGGGYAATGFESNSDNSMEPIEQWKPELGKLTQTLLVDRMLPACEEDNTIAAICLLWIGKNDEASWVLSGLFEMDTLRDTKFTTVPDFASRFHHKLTSSKSTRSPWSSIHKSNAFIDVSSVPKLLNRLKGSNRVRLATSLAVCDVLASRGLELPAVNALREVDRRLDSHGTDQTGGRLPATKACQSSSGGPPNVSSSSIFDSFEIPRPPKPAPSSIFDDFDPPKGLQPSPAPASNSIFADFDVPKPTPQTTQAPSSIFDSFDVPHAATKPTAPASTSIFDDFDVPQKTSSTLPTASSQGQQTPSSVEPPARPDVCEWKLPPIPISMGHGPAPGLWTQWQSSKVNSSLARRLIREVASIVSRFYGDPSSVPLDKFYLHSDNLLSPCVAEALQLPCDSEAVFSRLQTSISELCDFGKVSEESLIQASIDMLGPSDSRRIIFGVLLHHAIGRSDHAEGVVRQSSNEVIRWCSSFSLSCDSLLEQRRTRSFCSSHFMRREAARLSWQLESCLWLHRGARAALSHSTQQEATVAVRVGLLLASWNRDYYCLESLLSSLPDCPIDEEAGRQLWRSMKLTLGAQHDALNQKASSGGWEFLVNCKRSQATDLLREKSTGCFIIRPHTENTGVFTLSFKTNLVPAPSQDENDVKDEEIGPSEAEDEGDAERNDQENDSTRVKKVRKEDVVQHAIIRLSETGFRCGSFGPFTSLISLLEAVSDSLPFKLRFDLPPKNRVIPEEGSQTSPNAVLLRKLTLRNASSLITRPPGGNSIAESYGRSESIDPLSREHLAFGQILQLTVLCSLQRQLCGIAATRIDPAVESTATGGNGKACCVLKPSRMLQPFARWCRRAEITTAHILTPELKRELGTTKPRRFEILDTSQNGTVPSDAFEITPRSKGELGDSGDSILRGMVQPESGLEFNTLRLIDGGECTILILFSRSEAIRWFLEKKVEETDEEAVERLRKMEESRAIEAIDMSKLPIKHKPTDIQNDDVRYRIVDPWEVEAVKNRDGETRGASIGRSTYATFSLGQVALATEHIFRDIGGVPLLELWASVKGGLTLTKAMGAVQPPWESADSGDLQMNNGNVIEPALLFNSMRQHLYRNSLFRQLSLPQRFLALVQVEMLDLKNLTSPGGLLSLTAYALLRLKRAGSGGPLTNKARTIDSAATHPVKLNKTSGPHAPASWGSVVRFRFPLPEEVQPDGQSESPDQEALFKGPPCFLQVSVYERKLLVDHSLGTADISMDGLGAGGQLEEWVPLRTETRGITWFARIRLTLRFELMCCSKPEADSGERPVGVGLERIHEVSRLGGSAHEDVQKRSSSSPDLLQGFFTRE